MPSAPKKQWNEVGHYYEEKQENGSYKQMMRPTPKKRLTQEKFSAVLLDLMKPNHNEKRLLDTADLQQQVALGVAGSTERRDEDDFGEWETPIVFWKKGKVNKEEVDIPVLRWVSTTRPNDNYLTFIYRKLWAYDLQEVERMLKLYEELMKKENCWKDYGWSSDLPPEKGTRGKLQHNASSFIKLLQEKQRTKNNAAK